MTIKDIVEKQSYELGAEPTPPSPRIQMAEDAYIGIVGRFVDSMAPITEADRVALLAHYLAYFGGMLGRSVWALADGHRHFCNLFVALIGETSKGRKGTARRRTQQVFNAAFPEWVRANIANGLSTGEGLIYRVRDGDPNYDPDHPQQSKLDAGVVDKRLLIVEEELSLPFKHMKRQGNILSATLRSSWDGDTLQTIVKNDPNISTGAHISLLGHGVKEEIAEEVDQVSVRNGLANRFLWLWSERSKFLPRGGRTPANMDHLVADLQHAVSNAEVTYQDIEVDFDHQALNLWDRVYYELSSSPSGFIGRLTSRAEAITLRLALIYAVLDGSMVIEDRHLRAAISVWDYSMESVRKIWGNATGNRHAEMIAASLADQPEGFTRDQIHKLFNGHIKSEEMTKAIDELVRGGLHEVVTIPTSGRNKEILRAREERKAR